jgi:ABC-type bacteriocin/lantibiotic exporter with double-glycine peptidase domain
MTTDFPNGDVYSALARLRPDKRRRIPLVRQLHTTDCGAACLATVLGHHGRFVSLDDLRQEIGVDGSGASAHAIAQCAARHGLRARGISLDIEALDYLPPASILHWEFRHFVVFERVTRAGVVILDPAVGRRVVPMQRFREAFTGVALVLERTDAFAEKDRTCNPVWTYLGQLLGQRQLLSRLVVTSILLRVFVLAAPILTAMVVDRIVPRGDDRLLLLIGSGLAAMVVFQFLSHLIRDHLMLQLRTNLDTRMTLGFVDHLVGLPYEFFQRRSAGDLIMRVASNATIREILSASTLTAILDGTLVTVYLLVIFYFSAPMAGLVLGLGAVQVLTFLATRRRIRDLMGEQLETQARSQSYLVQVLAGMQSLKAAGAEARSIEKWSNLFVDELNVSLQRGRLDAVVQALLGAVQLGAPLLILGFGAVEVMGGRMTLGTMLAVNGLAAGFLTPLSSLVSSGLRLQLLGSYIERITDVLAAAPEQDRERVRPAPRLTGAVSVERLSFRYGDSGPLVLEDVSLDIPAGSSMAIVGRSGSGKSTLAHLLMGLYRPTQGRVAYDGHDIWEMDLRTVRAQIGAILQQPYIFGGSIRENIAMGRPGATMSDIVDAARLASIHSEIVAMPIGYETPVTDAGESLSGGQRQRLALARALLRRPALVVLDEATSSLDAASEKEVMDNLSRLRCTRIIIAHRLSTITQCDQIVVVDKGAIAEIGTHDQLMVRGGIYFRLVSSQAEVGRQEVAA